MVEAFGVIHKNLLDATDPIHHIFGKTCAGVGRYPFQSTDNPTKVRPGKKIPPACGATERMQDETAAPPDSEPMFDEIEIIAFQDADSHAKTVLPRMISGHAGYGPSMQDVWQSGTGRIHQPAKPASLARSMRLALKMRFFTMLMGISSLSAISSYFNPEA